MALTQGQLSAAQQAAYLGAALRGGSYSSPTKLYIGVSSTAPTDADGTGLTEPAIGTDGYERAELDPTTENWNAPTASGSGQVVTNAVDIDFAESTGAWASGAQFPWATVYTDPTSTSSADLVALGKVSSPSGGPSVPTADVSLVIPAGDLAITLT